MRTERETAKDVAQDILDDICLCISDPCDEHDLEEFAWNDDNVWKKHNIDLIIKLDKHNYTKNSIEDSIEDQHKKYASLLLGSSVTSFILTPKLKFKGVTLYRDWVVKSEKYMPDFVSRVNTHRQLVTVKYCDDNKDIRLDKYYNDDKLGIHEFYLEMYYHEDLKSHREYINKAMDLRDVIKSHKEYFV